MCYNMVREVILMIHNVRLAISLTEGQADMVRIERNRDLTSINANVLPVGRQHMEIPPQGNVALRGRNMLTLHNLLPLAVANAVLAVKIYLRHHRRHGLRAVVVVKP